MKLTIKAENGQKKVIELGKNLEFSVAKGEQYFFSKGFSSYSLNIKVNNSVELVFNIDGKKIKVDLKGIVPLLQANLEDNTPTSIVINKNIDDKDIDNILDNNKFSGSEIIDKLESLISVPIDLNTIPNKITLISDFQSLIESLDAAAAGGEQNGAISNGSTFNSIFSSIDDNLSGIAETDRWENLTESISSLPVETGFTLFTVAPPVVVVPQIVISDSSVNEEDGLLTFVVSLRTQVQM